jgi:hypothetical protein
MHENALHENVEIWRALHENVESPRPCELQLAHRYGGWLVPVVLRDHLGLLTGAPVCETSTPARRSRAGDLEFEDLERDAS